MKKRIRIDNLGLITQDNKGRMKRISMNRSEVSEYETLTKMEINNKLSSRDDLGKFLLPDGILDANVDRYIDWKTECLTRPLRHYYGIEPHCDLHCSFCGPRKLSFLEYGRHSDYEQFILNEIADSGAFQVQLTGGEVFLRGVSFLDTLEYCRSLGLGVLLATNGYWSKITDKYNFVKKLAELDNIVEIKVSVDGDEIFHDKVRGQSGSYQAAINTIALLAEQGIPTRINTTIFKDSCNIDTIDHIAGLAKTYGVAIQAVPERACGRSFLQSKQDLPSKEQLKCYIFRAKELREQYGIPLSYNFDVLGGAKPLPNYDPERPFSCGAGLWGFAITHEGEIYPCGFAIEAGVANPFLAGVVKNPGDMLHVWLHSPLLYEWRNAEKSNSCQNCTHYMINCWGGCKVQAWRINGSLSAEDPYCFLCGS